MEDLISQLTAASQEQQTVVKKYQNVNKALIKEQEKKEEVIKELDKELRKTKLASENSKVERGNSHSFQKKLEENERQLVEANNAIKILKQEKVKIEKEVAERKEIDLLERRKFLCIQKEEMDKLYEEQEQQRRENVMFREQLEKLTGIERQLHEQQEQNVMLREQLEKTGRQYHENLNRVEQERDALKHQVEEWVKKNHTTGKSGFI
jgi:hypothetical protein